MTTFVDVGRPLFQLYGELPDFVKRVKEACIRAAFSKTASQSIPSLPIHDISPNINENLLFNAPLSPSSKDEHSRRSSLDTEDNDNGYTENGAKAELISDFENFVVKFGNASCSGFSRGFSQEAPGMIMRKAVQEEFTKLWNIDNIRAFRHAMMLGNLRKGMGGYANMDAWVACMEVVWKLSPLLLIRNIEHIMQDTSYKWGLTLLKHFSNNYCLSDLDQNRNNYWGNLAHANRHTIHRFLIRARWVMEVQSGHRPHPVTPYALHDGKIFNLQQDDMYGVFKKEVADSSQTRRRSKALTK